MRCRTAGFRFTSSVCWGNTHRFLEVTANGPFDGIDVGFTTAPALGDLDGDGTLRPRPSIDKLRPHVFVSLAGDLDLVVGNGDGVLIYIENTGTSTAPVFVQGPEARTPSTASTSALTAPPRSETSTATARSDRVRRSINCDQTSCLSQATWTSSWAIGMACSSTSRTPGRLRRRRSCKAPGKREPLSTATAFVGYGIERRQRPRARRSRQRRRHAQTASVDR